MLASSSGLAIAWRAASAARCSPVPRPRPMSAGPASFITDRISAKSRLISPGAVIRSMIPCDRLEEDVVDHAERIEHRRVLGEHVGHPIVRDDDQRIDIGLELGRRGLGHALAMCTLEGERLGHDARSSGPPDSGRRGDDRRSAEPVPPPRPAVTNTRSAPATACAIFAASSSAARAADLRVAAGAEAARDGVADPDLRLGGRSAQRLGVRVADHEARCPDPGLDHAVDRVAAATADTDHADRPRFRPAGRDRPMREPRSGGGDDRRTARADDDDGHGLARDRHVTEFTADLTSPHHEIRTWSARPLGPGSRLAIE